jgi:flavin reductase (DIM6/NTAB) family NADH-FMN oxidoreductase RutF
MVELKDWVRALYPMHTFLITSIGEKGTNVFTVDWITVISRRPAILCVSVSPLRYSHKLIKESDEFIVNVPPAELLEKAYKCGVLSGRNCDK